MPSLLRDNAGDSRVAEDIASLTAAYDDDAVAASLAAMETARSDDLGLLAAAYAEELPPEELPAQRVVAALMRYRLYVGAAAVFLAIILFVNPVPLSSADGPGGDTFSIPTADGRRATSASDVESPIINSSDVLGYEFAAPGVDDISPSIANAFTEPASPPAAPAALRITQSGYASTFAETPAQQEPPQDGLPTEAIAGQVTQYSFVRLAGGGNVLRLKPVSGDGAAINAGAARVQLCQITTSGWKPARNVRPADAPAYNNQCLAGQKGSNGVWAFTFSSLFNPVAANGWAIVPYAAENETFRLTFAPTAA